ncbi:unnamed protein product [Prunus brigantina]
MRNGFVTCANAMTRSNSFMTEKSFPMLLHQGSVPNASTTRLLNWRIGVGAPSSRERAQRLYDKVTELENRCRSYGPSNI